MASQNIATGLTNGLKTSASQNLVFGDEIRISDGTQGAATKLGVLGMEIEGKQHLTQSFTFNFNSMKMSAHVVFIDVDTKHRQ